MRELGDQWKRDERDMYEHASEVGDLRGGQEIRLEYNERWDGERELG